MVSTIRLVNLRYETQRILHPTNKEYDLLSSSSRTVRKIASRLQRQTQNIPKDQEHTECVLTKCKKNMN